MALSRRTFLTSAVSGAALAAGAAVGLDRLRPGRPSGELKARLAAATSPAGDVVGKITVGYQGWFACIGDGAPIDGWWHWSNDWSQPPSPSNNALKAWPDMTAYDHGYQTAYADLSGGGAATLFSSFDQQTVGTHFQWMQANGIDYQPCVLPGDLSARQRAHGDFMWRQFYNMVRVGAQGLYISMFDEYGEGNQIAATAATAAAVPAGPGLLALDEDGTACSADYYLRLTADGGRMLKGDLALTATRPTPPVPDA